MQKKERKREKNKSHAKERVGKIKEKSKKGRNYERCSRK
jgi:uncharacterized protein YjbJ (UPF0337 family)